MSVTSTEIVSTYAGNNSTVTPYVITLVRDRDEDLKLEVDGVVSTDFTITLDEFRTGTAIPVLSELKLYRVTPGTQEQTFPSNTTPAAEDARAGFDKLTMWVRELFGRALQSAPSDEIADLPSAADRANKALGFDVNGDPEVLPPFTSADETKLDGIETAATADQSDAEIRAAVEAATDSNAFTDTEKATVAGLATVASSGDYADLSNTPQTTITLVGVTGKTGGGGANLDGVATGSLLEGHRVRIDANPLTLHGEYVLSDSAFTEDGVKFITPDDDATRTWVQTSFWAANLTAQNALVAGGKTSLYGGLLVENEVEFTLGTLTDVATVVWDVSTDGTRAKVTVTAVRELAKPTGVSSGKAAEAVLYFYQDGVGGYTPTFAAGISLASGSFNTAAGALTILQYFTPDGGTTWHVVATPVT